MPEAIIAFLDSCGFEDAIRKGISLGGDSDTIACIAGAIADAFYGGVPRWMSEYCSAQLDIAQILIIEAIAKRYPREPQKWHTLFKTSQVQYQMIGLRD